MEIGVEEENRWWQYLVSLKNSFLAVMQDEGISEETRSEIARRTEEIEHEIDTLCEKYGVML